MIVTRNAGILLLVSVIGFTGAELGEQFSVPGVNSLIPTAEAVVGRPLTPVSVAGVARRTGRRCATGVYNC